jgi:hypothetical protein
MKEFIEYVFIDKNGDQYHEIVDRDCGYSVARQVRIFSEMHNAIKAYPVYYQQNSDFHGQK